MRSIVGTNVKFLRAVLITQTFLLFWFRSVPSPGLSVPAPGFLVPGRNHFLDRSDLGSGVPFRSVWSELVYLTISKLPSQADRKKHATASIFTLVKYRSVTLPLLIAPLH